MISHRTLAIGDVCRGRRGGRQRRRLVDPYGLVAPTQRCEGDRAERGPRRGSSRRGPRADVVIRVDGAISLKHFTMAKPDKIVIDLAGASLGVPAGDSYDGVARGGITRVRYSQFTKSTVRVVLTLDAPHAYNVAAERRRGARQRRRHERQVRFVVDRCGRRESARHRHRSRSGSARPGRHGAGRQAAARDGAGREAAGRHRGARHLPVRRRVAPRD